MKKIPLLSLLLVSINFVGCDAPKLKRDVTESQEGALPASESVSEKATPPARLFTFPLKRMLTDNKGRSFEADVLGKSSGFLSVRRGSDAKKFSVSLDQLCLDDQRFFSTVLDSSPEEIAKLREIEKPKIDLSSRRASWLTDLTFAKNDAAKYDLPIYVLFTGSTWCPPCKMLEKSVLSTSEFKAFSDKSLVLVKFDVPSGGGGSSSIRSATKEFGIRSYPTVVLLDSKGKEVKRTSGFSRKSPSSYIDNLKKQLGSK